jgi:hypothetical protein
MTPVMQPLRREGAGRDPCSSADSVFLTRRRLRRVLGLLWLLDGALQLQSFMFTEGFARDVIAPAGNGQPSFVAGPVHWNAVQIGLHPALSDSAFAGIQLVLGLSLLFRRKARVALVCSMMWAGGIWYFGEGLGGLAGGHVTALLGAPGAACLSVVLALAAWPSSVDSPERNAFVRSERPPGWTRRVWAVLWVGYAVLNLLPANISPSTLGSQLNANATTVPSWLGAFDRWLARDVHAVGAGATVMLVTIELAVGLLVLGDGRLKTPAIWTGVGLAALYWAAGQSFGQLFSGQATDPSTGPLLILLGLVGVGAAREARHPRVRALRANRDRRAAGMAA